MWAGGFFLSHIQQYRNNKLLKKRSSHIVMCIGESTTAQKYPLPLQTALDKQYPGKFSIIDCGIEAARLTKILENLDNNIKKYHPDIAVCMMGINDGFYQYQENAGQTFENSAYKNIKIYKLYSLLKKHFQSYFVQQKAIAQETSLKDKNDQILKQITYLLDKQAFAPGKKTDFEKAVKTLNTILKTDPFNEVAYSHLINIYVDFLNNEQTACKMALKALTINHFTRRDYYYTVLINSNIKSGNMDNAVLFINQMIGEENMTIHPDLFKNVKNHIPDTLKMRILNKMTSSLHETDKSYAVAAINCIEEKDFEKAGKYFDMAEKLRIQFPNKKTNKMYSLIVQKLIDKNIKVICMQYPVRNIKPLQNILKDTLYYDKITFLSNEEIFKKILKENNYGALFVDQFAGDFGHCTDYGNTLIAQNVAKTLTDLTKND